MESALDQLKQFTTVVADTGDFHGEGRQAGRAVHAPFAGCGVPNSGRGPRWWFPGRGLADSRAGGQGLGQGLGKRRLGIRDPGRAGLGVGQEGTGNQGGGTGAGSGVAGE